MAFADLIVGKWNRNLFPWFTPGSRLSGCISFVSYIKPQLTVTKKEPSSSCISFVSYIKPQPSFSRFRQQLRCISFVSYIKPQPFIVCVYLTAGCISFVSYIKPQPRTELYCRCAVVYLSFPTSNHNL